MFHLISKLVSFLLEPLSWVFILFILAWLVKNLQIKRRYFWAGILCTLFFGNGAVISVAEQAWISKTDLVQDTTIVYDYAFVLGGFGTYNPLTKRTRMMEQGERLTEMLRLYHKGRIKKLFISGDDTFANPSYPESRLIFLKYLSDFGICEKDVILDKESLNTYQNAKHTAVLIGEDLIGKRCLLVTSAVHMPRALACYHKAGIFPTPFATSVPVPFELKIYNFGISASNFEEWSLLTHELFGVITYRLIGYS